MNPLRSWVPQLILLLLVTSVLLLPQDSLFCSFPPTTIIGEGHISLRFLQIGPRLFILLLSP